MGRSRKGPTPPYVLQLRATVASNLLAAVRRRAKEGEDESTGFKRLAAESGVGYETIRRACKDYAKDTVPDLNLFNLAKLAHALGFPPGALLTPYALETAPARTPLEDVPAGELQRRRN
jgi:hypothetical protein